MEKLIFSGFGGQGVLTLGQIIASMALEKDLNVTWMPSYGAEMRGGTANCAVVISETEIGCPLVSSNADFVFALNDPSVDKFMPMLKSGGVLVVNSSIVTKDIARDDITIIKIDATNIAIALGSAKVANMVMIAGYLKMTDKFTLEDVEAVMKKKFAGKNEKFIPINLSAIKKGLEEIQ